MPAEVPALAGVLSAGQVARTAAAVAATAEPSGAVPWSPGEHTDVWNHVEAAMAMLVGGEVEAAEAAYDWVGRVQRADGSVPLKLVAGEVHDASGETNMSAYLAVGLWHHWLVRRDPAFVRRHWPVVRAGLDWVASLQLPFGGIAWSQEWADGRPARVNEEALLAGSSSILHSLRAGVALGELVGDPQPGWELVAGRLLHALRAHPDAFMDKSRYSMDWYYPVLGGAVRGPRGRRLLAARWTEFVVPGLGVRCVADRDWFTGAETCELVLALDAVGETEAARRLLADVQRLRHENGSYWTGWVVPEGVRWPHEQTSYTASAVLLAVDAISRTTAGADLVRGATLGSPPAEIAGDCGCASARVLVR